MNSGVLKPAIDPIGFSFSESAKIGWREQDSVSGRTEPKGDDQKHGNRIFTNENYLPKV